MVKKYQFELDIEGEPASIVGAKHLLAGYKSKNYNVHVLNGSATMVVSANENFHKDIDYSHIRIGIEVIGDIVLDPEEVRAEIDQYLRNPCVSEA